LAAAERLGFSWGDPQPHTSAPTGIYATTIRHTRRTPWKRSFTHHSHTWLVDVDELPDHGLLGRFESRDHLGDPDRTLRQNVAHFLRQEGVELGAGRVLMATQPRAFGFCFNPITVFWVWPESAPPCAVVEVHNTYGDRHAYLVHPDEQGRATTPKQMYVSPFHGTDGTYELAVPVPGDQLVISVNLTTDDGARFSASLTGHRTAGHSRSEALRAAPAALRGALLIRLHGIALWLRRLPIRPRPAHHQEGVR